MQSELLNLLPPDRAKKAKRSYFVRLVALFLLTLAAVLVANGALLVPSYLFVSQQISLRQARIAAIDKELGATQGKEVSQHLANLSANAVYLARLGTTTSATAALRGVLTVPRTGVVLTGFSYMPPTGPGKGKLSISGVAATRENLRMYNDALGTLPFVSTVDLPISAYAKENTIPFTITLTGTLTP